MLYDIGIRFYHSPEDKIGYIDTYIPVGTVIPASSVYEKSYTLHEHQRNSYFSVHEAIKTNPDRNKPSSDYVEIMSVELDREAEVPVGTPSETRLCIDSNGILTVEARDPAKPDKPPITNHVKLKKLS